jgi:ABC-type proline/glycine betaine transport system permease subunit
MKMIKFSLKTMMAAILIIGVNLGLVVVLYKAEDPTLFLVVIVYAGIPSLTLLALALAKVASGLWRQGKSPEFSTGYLLAGSIATFGIMIAISDHYRFIDIMGYGSEWMEWIFPSSSWSMHRRPGFLDEAIFLSISLVKFALPQIVPALIGGGLAARYGLAMILCRHNSTSE